MPRKPGAFCGSWAGAASVQWGGRWSGTKKRSGCGSRSVGRRLKKSPQRGAHHRLHRRERIERAPAPLPYLGATRTDAGAAISNWKTLSAMAGVTWWNFYFRLFPGAIRSPQIIEFLMHLLRHIPGGKLLIVWDGLPGHRSGAVWDFVRQQKGCLWLEFLPAYATELNPVEYLWSHWKQHELPNFCPSTFGQWSHYARQALHRMRRAPTQ